MASAAGYVGGLLRLALVEGDRLGVLAEAHERVAQVGLAQQLLGVLADERLAELHRRDRADAGVGEDRVEELLRSRGVAAVEWSKWSGRPHTRTHSARGARTG